VTSRGRKEGEPGTPGATTTSPAQAASDEPVDEAMVKKRSLASLREWVDHSKQRLDEWQKQVNSKIQTTIDGISHSITPWGSVNKDVRALADRISDLEAKLAELEAHEDRHAAAAAAAAPAAAAPAPEGDA
jgi:polyhydroxyalkanoate synthesis regulator phasin